MTSLERNSFYTRLQEICWAKPPKIHMPTHILEPRVFPGLLEFPKLAETLNNLFPSCVWSWTEDSATLKFKFFVHFYSNYQLDFKINVYLCIFQTNVFYCLKCYCHVKNKKLNKPVHFSINCKLFCTGKLNKKLTLNPQKKLNSNDFKTPKCMSNLQHCVFPVKRTHIVALVCFLTNWQKKIDINSPKYMDLLKIGNSLHWEKPICNSF